MDASLFQHAVRYYIRTINTPNNVAKLIELCKKKHPRGVNIVFVDQKMIDDELFIPGFFVDPGRFFSTVENVPNFIEGVDINDVFWSRVKMHEKTYNPDVELLFVVMTCDGLSDFWILGE